MRVSSAVDWFMDKTVVPGYSRLGPTLRKAWWLDDPEPDALAGRHVVVTGASSGLGAATVVGLARLGRHRAPAGPRPGPAGRLGRLTCGATSPRPAPRRLTW